MSLDTVTPPPAPVTPPTPTPTPVPVTPPSTTPETPAYVYVNKTGPKR